MTETAARTHLVNIVFGYRQAIGLTAILVFAFGACARQHARPARRAMIVPAAGAGGHAWSTRALFTVGDVVGEYAPPGLLDGIGALATENGTLRVLVTHEIAAGQGYAYALANGTRLTGARITEFDVARRTRTVRAAALAYDGIVDRKGHVVTRPVQVNEGRGHSGTDGLNRLCSAVLVHAGTNGLRDDILFTGEEGSEGTLYALDVSTRTLHAVPAAGRAQFENVAPVETGDTTTVAFLMSDDNNDTPLYLYVGRRGRVDAGFLERNGLASGDLYAWVSDSGERNADTFHGTGQSRAGYFTRLPVFQPARAGQAGYDDAGWATMKTQHELARRAGAYALARPEDIAPNPSDPLSAVFVTTGSGTRHPADTWGTVTRVDMGFTPGKILASLTIVYDGDDSGAGQFMHPDAGLRSPDNVVWSSDGDIYVQEDRATPAFGSVSGREASIWRIDSSRGSAVRVAQIDRAAVPAGQTDTLATEIGAWESSGIVDVTDLFGAMPGQRIFLATVQAHTLVGPALGGAGQPQDRVEGGQLLMLLARPVPR